MKYIVSLCLAFFSIGGFAMEPQITHVESKSFETAHHQWLGTLSNGSKVLIDIHNKKLRKGLTTFYSGRIDKKKLTRQQAKSWGKRLELIKFFDGAHKQEAQTDPDQRFVSHTVFNYEVNGGCSWPPCS